MIFFFLIFNGWCWRLSFVYKRFRSTGKVLIYPIEAELRLSSAYDQPIDRQTMVFGTIS